MLSTGSRQFSLAHRRAVATLPLIQARCGAIAPQTLLDGLQKLASRAPELRKPPELAARAVKELDKYAWAFPDSALSKELSGVEQVVRAGFDHASAIISRLRSAIQATGTDRAVLDKLLGKAFREAVKARKAAGASGVNIEQVAVRIARSKLAALDAAH